MHKHEEQHTHDHSCCGADAHQHEPHKHGHDHSHSGHDHDHFAEIRSLSQKRLWIALAINLAFLFVEIVGGLLTNSLALLADAGHMFTDVVALGLAIFAFHLAGKPATGKRTFGYLRAEVIGAFINGGSLVLIVGMIIFEAVRRMGTEVEVVGPWMLFIAVLGLLANVGSAMILFGGRHESVNIEGAFLHMVADALGSVGAIIAGAVIWLTGWMPIDIVVSLVIGALILYGSLRLLKKTLDILLESTPEGISVDEVRGSLENVDHIEQVTCLHIWTISTGITAVTAHVRLSADCADTAHWQACTSEARRILAEDFEITHVTLQAESEDSQGNPCSICAS